jgi:hypothetical protein
MPTYSFKNLKTGEIYDLTMRISEREQYLKDHKGEVESVVTAPFVSYDNCALGKKQPDEGFKDLLRDIRSNAIGGSHIQSKYI